MSTRPEPFVFIGGTSEPGGVHVHTADVAMAVAMAGHEVTILCPSIDYFSKMFSSPAVQVEVIPERHPGQPAIAYWREHLARHRQATAVLVRGGIGEGLLADLMGIRLATHRLITVEHRNYDPPWPFARHPFLHGLVMRLMARRTIVVSEEIAHTATQLLKIPRSRVATCLNWVDPAYRLVTRQERAAAKKRYGLPPDALVVGFHGRLAPEKRIGTLIEAMAAIEAPAILVIVGDGWKRKELEDLVAARGLTGRTRMLGWQPDPVAAISAFDISVLPSLSEGFPVALLESMATGTACLAHPMSSTRMLIRSGENGILADLSQTSSFARALEGLIKLSTEERERLGAEAAQTIAQNYSRAQRLPAVLRALDIRDPDEAAAALGVRNRRLEFTRPTP